jgi:hypothetical protein
VVPVQAAGVPTSIARFVAGIHYRQRREQHCAQQRHRKKRIAIPAQHTVHVIPNFLEYPGKLGTNIGLANPTERNEGANEEEKENIHGESDAFLSDE